MIETATASTPAPTRAAESTADPTEVKPLIEFTGVQLGYARSPVLNNVNLKIEPGQFWCFLGPNGEGKTTLIKALLGAIRPQYGKLDRDNSVFGKGRVSYVPQRLELNPVLPTSVREFILAGLAGVRTYDDQRRKRLARVLEVVGLSASEHQNFWTLSGGQKQRALLARALARDPRVLIVDEPTAGLDFAAAETVLKVLADMHATYNVTIIFVTHDLHIVTKHATHAALFRGGAVHGGELSEVITAEKLGHTFGVPVPVYTDQDGHLQIGVASA